MRALAEETGLRISLDTLQAVGVVEGNGRDPWDTAERWVRSQLFIATHARPRPSQQPHAGCWQRCVSRPLRTPVLSPARPGLWPQPPAGHDPETGAAPKNGLKKRFWVLLTFFEDYEKYAYSPRGICVSSYYFDSEGMQELQFGFIGLGVISHAIALIPPGQALACAYGTARPNGTMSYSSLGPQWQPARMRSLPIPSW